MTRAFLVLGITLAAALPAHADLTHKIQSSVQLEVGGASTRAIRVGNAYSISGTGVDTSVTAGGSTTSDALGGLGSATNGVNAITIPDATQKTAGNAFSFATSYTQGDAVPTSAPTVGAVPAFGDVTSTASGTAGDLAGTITTAGAVTVTAGGANTSAIGQVISELTTR
tara:strand:+ start:634 stop:1140 length:507 start_codon:yes stop_codon:yes gene_type:complete